MSLDRMTVAQLRQYARDNGMSTITKLTKKADLLRAIKRFQENAK
jgi:hypothetical protein